LIDILLFINNKNDNIYYYHQYCIHLGSIDFGSWGGDSKSDIETRIIARNKECCRVINGFVQEFFNSVENNSYMKKIEYNNNKRNDNDDNDDNENNNNSNNDDDDDNRNRKQGVHRIAVLYGVYHISDLNKRLIEDYQFKIDSQYQSKQYTAWKIPGPMPSSSSSSLRSSSRFNRFSSSIISIFPKKYLFDKTTILNIDNNDNYDDDTIITSSSINKVVDTKDDEDDNILSLKSSDLIIISILLSIYLLLSAIDWWYIGHFLIHAIEQQSHLFNYNHQYNSYNDYNSLQFSLIDNNIIDNSIQSIDNDSISSSSSSIFNRFLHYLNNNNISNDLIIAIIYIISYIQRHIFLLRKISYVGIQWDRGLFTDL